MALTETTPSVIQTVLFFKKHHINTPIYDIQQSINPYITIAKHIKNTAIIYTNCGVEYHEYVCYSICIDLNTYSFFGVFGMITMTEIAKLTHVSQPTVSRVLSGSKKVDPEIRERVLACARAHDFQPSVLAQGLRGSKTNLLGVFLTDISNSFFSDLAKEIEAKAREYGYSIILFNSDHNPLKQREYIDVVRRYRVDGILMVPILNDPVMWQECVSKLNVPTVMITWPVEGFDSVYLDHKEAVRLIACHLTEKNYQRFLFVGERDDPKYKEFAQQLESMGSYPACEVACIEYEDDGELRRSLESFFRCVNSRAGIFANNDLCALQVLRALHELNISIPDEAGVIGFDDISISPYLQPSLSSVSQPTSQMADKAVTRLLYRINHSQESEALDLPLTPMLVSREST